MVLKTETRDSQVVGIILAALAMSVGWGFRGDYGHEAGAMVPGALLGLAICLALGLDQGNVRLVSCQQSSMFTCGAIAGEVILRVEYTSRADCLHERNLLSPFR